MPATSAEPSCEQSGASGDAPGMSGDACVHVAPTCAQTSSMASTAASPAIICSQPLTRESITSDCGSTVANDTIDDSPGRLTHCRPSLPWPAV